MNPFSTKGRISLKEYAWNIATSIVIFIWSIKLSSFLVDDLQLEVKIFYHLGFILLFSGVLYFIISIVCFTTRRLQDIGKSYSVFPMLFIPLYNLYLIMLLFSQIGFGKNIYGPEITKCEVRNKTYLIRLISIIFLIVISDIGFNYYNKHTLKSFLNNPAKNDQYIIETEPAEIYKYQLFDIVNLSDNDIVFAVGGIKYTDVSSAKEDIVNLNHLKPGYYIDKITISRNSIKLKKIERIIRYY